MMFNYNGTGTDKKISLTDGTNTKEEFFTFIDEAEYKIRLTYKAGQVLQVKIEDGGFNGGTCAKVLALATDKRYNMDKVRFESDSSPTWANPVVNLDGDAEVYNMTLKRN